jgi:hypothetical protein
MDGPLTIFAGDVVVRSILNGDTPSGQLAYTPSEAALQEIGETTRRAHKHYDIPCHLSSGESDADNSRQAFSLDRLRRLLGSWVSPLQTAASGYATATIPDEVERVPRDPFFGLDLYTVSPRRRALEHNFNQLFKVAKEGTFRPEAITFGAILRISHAALESPAALEIADRHRDALSQNASRWSRVDIDRNAQQTGAALCPLVLEALGDLNAEAPQISVPDAVAEKFLEDVRLDLSRINIA